MLKPPTILTFIDIAVITKKNSFFRLMTLIFSIVCMSNFNIKSIAQTPKLHIFPIEIEWNGKLVCDGYDPTPINAPGMSYSGTGVNEPSYEYSWSQKINDGPWKVVASEKGKNFIRSYNPPALKSTSKNNTSDTYSWQLQVTDKANGNQSEKSDIFTLKVSSPLKASYKVSSSKSNKNKFAIQLSISGGMSNKKVEWLSVDRSSKFPPSQKNLKDPDGLDPGIYQVNITDDCGSIMQTINTSNNNSTEKVLHNE